MVSINAELGIKGHNGFSPCRSCEMKGVRNVTGGQTNYYIPLTQPAVEGEPLRSWDPSRLPLRTHDSFRVAREAIRNAQTKKQADDLEMYHGINKDPALYRVSSVDMAQCYPWDWMHMFLENIIPALIKLWMGKYKGLNAGEGNYEIAEEVWEEIGNETSSAVKDIPAAFVRHLPNIATDRSSFTAEAWSFWFMELAPFLLHNRFADKKYHQHLCDLVDIMKICLQFEITDEEVNVLEQKIHAWVHLYEESASLLYHFNGAVVLTSLDLVDPDITISTVKIVYLFALPSSMDCSTFPQIYAIVRQSGQLGHFTWKGAVAISSAIFGRKAHLQGILISVSCTLLTWINSKVGLIWPMSFRKLVEGQQAPLREMKQ
jgi:hypothetical protein